MSPVVLPKIYVTRWCYNNAKKLRRGVWIDATKGVDAVQKSIDEWMRFVSGSNWMVADTQGFYPVQVNKYASIEEICQLADFIQQHGKFGRLLLASHRSCLYYAEQDLKHCYCGAWKSLNDFSVEFLQKDFSCIADSFDNDFFFIKEDDLFHVFTCDDLKNINKAEIKNNKVEKN